MSGGALVKACNALKAAMEGAGAKTHAVIGQVEGGAGMGAGYALREEYILGQTNDWKSIGFPAIAMSFPKETLILETPRTDEPLGATGIGEATMVSTHPAIANAIFNATGKHLNHQPITPDKVLAAPGK